MLYDDFKPVVDLVLNNWTALQLAVEHGMGAPGGEKVCFGTNINELALVMMPWSWTLVAYIMSFSGDISNVYCYLVVMAINLYVPMFSIQTAQLMAVYVARYCVENVVCVDDLTEVLEDLMDEEFETVCHDNSPKGKKFENIDISDFILLGIDR